jgi:glycine hydroxymethyltransferase
VDLRPLEVKGNEAEQILEDVSIVVNKNAIPYDPEPPRVASGLRLGAAAVTSRGFGRDDMRTIGELIVRAITRRDDQGALKSVKEEAEALASGFPVPGLDS